MTSLQAHGWGLAWFEQKRAKNGDITFVEHMVMDNYNTKNAGGVAFSELHGTAVADVDGDGIPDFIVGKRFWSHLDNYFDSDPYGPAVLYWHKTVRNPKAPGGRETGATIDPQPLGCWVGCARRRPERRWKDGYRDFDQERNLYLLGNPGRANKTAGKAR